MTYPGETPGMPRPSKEWTDPDGKVHILPIPWIGAESIGMHDGWQDFDSDKVEESLRGASLCTVCGDELPYTKVYAIHQHNSYRDIDGIEHIITGGTGMHARCAMIAVTTCPHFRVAGSINRDECLAIWHGDGHGFTQDGVRGYVDGGDMLLEEDAYQATWEEIKAIAAEQNKTNVQLA